MLEFVRIFFQKITEAGDNKDKNIATITFIGAIAAWVALPAYIALFYFTKTWQFEYLIYNNLALAIGLSLNYGLTRLRIRYIPAWITAIIVEVTFVLVNYFVKGLGIILASIMLVIVINIALQGMSFRPAIILLGTAIIATIACVVLDLFNFFPDRISTPAWLQQIIIVIGGTVILLLSINFIQSLQLSSIKTQLSIAFLLIAFIPLVTVLISTFITQNQDLKTIQNQELKQLASEISDSLDRQLIILINQTETHAKLPSIKKYLSGEDIALLETFSVLSEQNPFIVSYGLLNTQGVTLLDVRSFRIGQNNANTGWFRETMTRRSGYISEIIYDENLVRPVFYVSAPVFNESQEIIAVLRVQYDADLLRVALIERTEKTGSNLTALILDPNKIIVAHSSQPELQLKTLSKLRNEQISALQAASQLPPGSAESLSADLENLEQALKTASSAEFFNARLANNQENEDTVIVYKMINKNWDVVVGQINNFDLGGLLLANMLPIIVAAIIMISVIFAATIMSGFVAAPINSLALIAKEVGKGNLDITSGISRNDEIGTLARAFDDTNTQLRSILQNMELRVAQRTNELADANALMSRRAEQLKTISSVARAVSNLQSLKLLLPQITEEISKSFGYYHVGIFLLDPSGQHAILRAANSEGGQKMLSRGHRLRVGQVGIVGYVTGVGKARISLDVGDDATFFNNPDLPETHSEMALPLKTGGNVIGALDIQSKATAAFTKEDIELLSLLADQISAAIENSRLYEETRTALAEAQLIFSKTVQTNWNEITETEKSAFQFRNGQITEIILQPNLSEENDEELILPISIRGEKLGSLKIKAPIKREWNEQDVRIFQSIVDRLGFALENARLFRNAQRLVSKERVIGEITDKIGQSVNLDNILQTAAEELGRLISDSEITIQFSEDTDLGPLKEQS